MKKLLIIAYNVHTGGGKTLLLALLNNIPKNIELVLYADNRLRNYLTKYKFCIKYVKNNIISRLMAEISIRSSAGADDITLMFGGLPPIFKNNSYVYLFLQNLNNILQTSINEYNFNKFLRIKIERLWLKLFSKNVQTIIVQTLYVKGELTKSKLVIDDVIVLPFIETARLEPQILTDKLLNLFKCDSFIFIYPASNDPHKNHRNLLKAWEFLFIEEITPTLFLTLNDSDYNQIMDKLPSSLRVNVLNLGVIEHDLLLNLYERCNCLIFPSKYESFGLPLIEATRFRLPIIAPELDYVREVCSPVETFDPSSPLSIARAVKRFMNIDQPSILINEPIDFINFLVSNPRITKN